MKISVMLLLMCIPLATQANTLSNCENLANEIVQASQTDEQPIYEIAEIKFVVPEKRWSLNRNIAFTYQLRGQHGPYPKVQNPLLGTKRLVECTGYALLSEGVWFVYFYVDQLTDKREFWQLIPLYER